MLGQLLERVRKRATGPRTATPAPTLPSAAPVAAAPVATKEPPVVARAAEPAAMTPAVTPKPVAAPSEQVLPPARREDALPSEPPPPDLDSDEGPPSAPRLREGLAAAAEGAGPDEEAGADEQDFPEDEAPIKTPPPESGRQQVAPAVASSSDSSDDIDIDFSVTVTEGEITPLPPPVPEPVQMPAATGDIGLPRLSFVSEPEIEFHVRPPAPAAKVPEQASATSRKDASPRSAVVPIPAAQAKAPEPAVPDLLPTASDLPPRPSSVPPPVRLMAQPAGEAPGTTGTPVEVWASTHAPAALRGQVATFVGQNASFAPKSFGELLEATLQLGEEQS
jgi:hypothetical protein